MASNLTGPGRESQPTDRERENRRSRERMEEANSATRPNVLTLAELRAMR